jgi:putative ABC transport system permease protein
MVILRRLRKTPGFTVVCIVTLALGIGGTTAAFSVVHGVLLRPLPYHDPGRLVGMWHSAPGLGMPQLGQSDASYVQYYRNAQSFASVGGYDETTANLTGVAEPEHVRVVQITASLLPTLGARSLIGRAIGAEDDRPGAPPVVLLSHALWRRRFGAETAVVGRSIQLDGVAHEVIGIMPPTFQFPIATADLWRPIRIDAARVNAAGFNMFAVGRLRPDVTLARAEAELQTLLLRVPEENPGPLTRAMMESAGFRTVLRPLRDDVVGDIRPVLLTVLGTVAFVLLIACANVTNLFLVRAEARQREVAVRTAIGATPAHIGWLFLGESLALAAAGAVAGIAIAWAGLRVLLRFAPAGLPRASEIALDAPTLLVTVGVAGAAGLLFGALPLARTGKDLVPMLKDGTKGATTGRERQRMRNAFVVAQVALALVLLAGSGLMARSFQRLREVHPGFQAERVLTLRLALPGAEYRDPYRTAMFEQQIVDRVAALPGVRSAAVTTKIPLLEPGRSRTGIWIEDHPLPPNSVPTVHATAEVTDEYFRTMGIPLLEGRSFSREATQRATGEAIVSRGFARRFWPNGSALGKRLKAAGPGAPWATVVGVVGDVHDDALTTPAEEMVYQPLIVRQEAAAGQEDVDVSRHIALAVRTVGPPTALTRAVRDAIWTMDRKLPLVDVRPMTEIVAGAMARTTFTLLMLAIAAGVALLLGAIGIYGVISYMVSLRTREIGVRMALGAEGWRVGGLVVRQGVALAALGVVLGLVGTLGVGRLAASLLYDVAPTDPLTLGVVSVALLSVAVIASWLPARRAARIDPVDALRSE